MSDFLVPTSNLGRGIAIPPSSTPRFSRKPRASDFVPGEIRALLLNAQKFKTKQTSPPHLRNSTFSEEWYIFKTKRPELKNNPSYQVELIVDEAPLSHPPEIPRAEDSGEEGQWYFKKADRVKKSVQKRFLPPPAPWLAREYLPLPFNRHRHALIGHQTKQRHPYPKQEQKKEKTMKTHLDYWRPPSLSPEVASVLFGGHSPIPTFSTHQASRSGRTLSPPPLKRVSRLPASASILPPLPLIGEKDPTLRETPATPSLLLVAFLLITGTVAALWVKRTFQSSSKKLSQLPSEV